MSEFEDIFSNPINCSSPTYPPNRKDLIFTEELSNNLGKYDASTNLKEKKFIRRLVEKSLLEFNFNQNIIFDYGTKLSSIANNDSLLIKVLSSVNTLYGNFHQNISCLISAILQNDPDLNTRQKLHNWFRSITKTGEVNSYDFFDASFLPGNNLFTLKVAKRLNSDELSHEALMGIFVANDLRRFVPNFMYVYGYTKCSPVFFSDKIESWCDSSTPSVSYLISENTRDSIPIGDWIIEADYNSFIVVFLQLINALKIANKNYGFVNYNLTSSNIVVRTFNEEDGIVVPIYNFGDGIKNIITKHIPYITDYEFSEFYVGPRLFRNEAVSAQYPSNGFQMIDLYRLIIVLFVSLYNFENTKLIKDNNRKLNTLNNFFNFFGEGDILSMIYLATKNNSNYHVNNIHQTKTYEEFIATYDKIFSLVMFNEDIYPKANYIDFGKTMDTCEFYKLFQSSTRVRNTIEYINLIDHIQSDPSLSSDNKNATLNSINIRFNSDAFFRIKMKKIVNLLRICYTLVENLKNPISTQQESLEEFFYRINENIKSLMKIKSHSYEIRNFTTTNLRAFDIQGLTNIKSREKIKEIYRRTTYFFDILQNRRKDLILILNYINKELVAPGVDINLLKDLKNTIMNFAG